MDEPTTKHTEGRLTVDGLIVGQEHGILDVARTFTEADAARLVACWNACLPLPKPEENVRHMLDVHEADQTKIGALRAKLEAAEALHAEDRKWINDAVASCAAKRCSTRERRLDEAEKEVAAAESLRDEAIDALRGLKLALTGVVEPALERAGAECWLAEGLVYKTACMEADAVLAKAEPGEVKP